MTDESGNYPKLRGFKISGTWVTLVTLGMGLVTAEQHGDRVEWNELDGAVEIRGERIQLA